MNQTITIIVLLLVVLAVAWFMFRSTQRQVKQVLSGEKSLDDKDIWLRYSRPLTAHVISKKETRHPKATGIAKVDLELEIQIPQGTAIQVKTCWLVEIPALPELEAGKSVEVKLNPKKPEKVFPAVPWARLWVFGK